MKTMRWRIAARLARLEWAGAEFDSWREEAQEPLLAKADAILDELREPTEAMLNAGHRYHGHGDEMLTNCWQEMIDAARQPDSN